MKKIFTYTILCGLALLLLPACEKKDTTKKGGDPIESAMRGVFRVVTDSEETMQLLAGKSKTVEAHITIQENAISDQTVAISLKVDPEGVDVYNSTTGSAAEILPSSAYSFTSNNMMLARYNTSSTAAKIRITASGLEDDVLYVLPLTIDKVEGTENWDIAADPYAFITVMQSVIGPEGGDGSMEFPFELRTVADLRAMREKLSDEEKVYFKMMNDIDMAEINDWTPLNYADPYAFAIDFDGQGYTLDNFTCDFSAYPSFFGVLNGYCHDVTFTNAKVVVADARSGILAGYCGTGSIRGEVARVHIQGELDHTPSSKYGAGGFFGLLSNGAMYACSADVTVTSKLNNVGGLVGYCAANALITDCWTSGTITGGQRVGGIIGGTSGADLTAPDNVRIINCYSTATVHGSFAIGGIGGFFNGASTTKGSPATNTPGNHFEKCIAWNDEIRANWNQNTGEGTINSGDVSHYSDGAIVGYTAKANYLAGCLRNPAMKYDEVMFFDYTDAFSLYDQDDASPSAPLMITAVEGADYNYPYHGKAAPSGKTLSEVAKSLGWSTAIWDFSGEKPTLKPDAPVGPVPDVTAGGQLPGFGDNDLN